MLFVRHESLPLYIKRYPISALFIGMVLLSMLVKEILLTIGYGWVVDLAVLSPSHVVEGEVWRLITYVFLHNGMFHLLFNLFFFYLFAPPLERIYGKVGFIFILLVTALTGSLTILFFDPAPTIGASGIDFGLMGVYFHFIVRKKRFLDESSKQTVLVFLVIGFLSSVFIPNISIMGHLGGFIGGYLIPFLLKSRRSIA
ncbi:putative rhomboid protease ydcA [[Clostridium] ultunense Esp]|uniref:rhomboid family intramembrane serine protease n=1 Tax=Thermicanus aegyptius TaxID=94009 RepID=UPI0002B6F86C|nr:rhomboid family intramembrane serine protease [Thermicanus aegyptius]CCQ93793.1 putative rhomboid protease ydcA [[Clostridium] ultunense Esp]